MDMLLSDSPARRDLTPAELSDLRARVTRENVTKLAVVAVVGSLLNAWIGWLEVRSTGEFGVNPLIRVWWIGASFAYLSVITVMRRLRIDGPWTRATFLGAAGLSLFCSALIAGHAPPETGYTFIFIINILLTAALFTLDPFEIGVVTAPSLLYLGGLMIGEPTRAVSQTGNVINIVAVSVFAVVIAVFGWQGRRRRHLYEVLLHESNRTFRDLADRDGLTGVANRRKIDEMIVFYDQVAGREPISLAVAMIDIDGFKAYNDSYGHLAGDEVLKGLASRMAGALPRAGDFLGRYGGEEFVVFLPGTDGAGAQLTAERLRRAVSDLGIPHEYAPARHVTVSIGVAAGELGPDLQVTALITAADRNLYRAKLAGRNRVIGD